MANSLRLEGDNIYNYRARVTREIENLKGNQSIEQGNRQLILEFLDHYGTMKELSLARKTKLLGSVRNLAQMLGKPFENATVKDLDQLIMAIKKREDWGKWSKYDHIVVLKLLYKWLKKNRTIDRAVIDYITEFVCEQPKPDKINANELLTQEDVIKMIDATKNVRDKAFIACLWESGARIEELGTLRWKDIEYGDKALKLNIKGKTGERTCWVVNAAPYLATWKDLAPNRTDSNGFVWVISYKTARKPAMSYHLFRNMLRRLAIKAGISKKVNPHFFRKSAASFRAKNGWNEALLNQQFGWVQGSRVSRHYVFIADDALKNRMLKDAGLPVNDEEKQAENLLKPKNCPRCGVSNPATSTMCQKCGCYLDARQAIEHEDKEKAKLQGMVTDTVKVVLEQMLNIQVSERKAQITDEQAKAVIELAEKLKKQGIDRIVMQK